MDQLEAERLDACSLDIDADRATRNGGRHVFREDEAGKGELMIRMLRSGEYRLYSRKRDAKSGKRRNLGTFKTRAAAERHERAIQFFKRR
jgi:hypothetical protein